MRNDHIHTLRSIRFEIPIIEMQSRCKRVLWMQNLKTITTKPQPYILYKQNKNPTFSSSFFFHKTSRTHEITELIPEAKKGTGPGL